MTEEEKQAKNNIKKSIMRDQWPIKMNYCQKKQKKVKKKMCPIIKRKRKKEVQKHVQN